MIKLIKNELTKNFKKTFTVILIIIAMASVFFICIYTKFYIEEPDNSIPSFTESTFIRNLNNMKIRFDSEKMDDLEREMLKARITAREKVLELDIVDSLELPYKLSLLYNNLTEELEELFFFKKEGNKEKFNAQKEQVEKVWNLFLSGTFEEYIAYLKEKETKLYNLGETTLSNYNSQMAALDRDLKYEFNKYSDYNNSWKSKMSTKLYNIEQSLEIKYDLNNKVYLNESRIKYLENQKLLIDYRLTNNIAPHYSKFNYGEDYNAYRRYIFHKYGCFISMFLVGLLGVVLGASCISEEKSKGTIKFLLTTSAKRYKILLAKILAILIILIIATIIVSQVSALCTNIFYPNINNDYLYVLNGSVKVMPTYIYETLYYLLKIPEIMVYVLIGVACSVLMKNIFSNIAATTIYTALTLGIEYFTTSVIVTSTNINYFRYFPFEALRIADKVFYIDKYDNDALMMIPTTLTFSIGVILVISLIMLIIAFDGFRKKEI